MKHATNRGQRANHRIVAVLLGFILCFFSLSLILSSAKAADQATPTGVWKTIDDATHKPKSHVQIWERNGIFYGKIIKLIDPDEPNPLCNKCEGKNKDKPVIGMRIMWNLKKNGDSEWGDGFVLDPDNGKIYRCKVTLVDNGKKLEVRGFIGFSVFGRTQVWHRIK